MARAARSVDSQIQEHQKYRRQCQIRIKPSLQLVALGVALAGGLLWWQPTEWVAAIVIVAIPIAITALEYWGYVRHDRAIRRLSGGQDI